MGEPVRGKLVLARSDSSTAEAFAHHRAGLSSALSRLTRGVKEREIALSCTAAALHIAGRDAEGRRDTLKATGEFRFTLMAMGGEPYPRRELRSRFRVPVEARSGHMDVDITAHNHGPNAWGPTYRSP